MSRQPSNLNLHATYYMPRSMRRESNLNEIQTGLDPFLDDFVDEDFEDYDNYDFQRLSRRRNNLIIPRSFSDSSSLEFLLSIPQRINSEDNNEEDDNNKLSFNDFKEKNINKLKEDLLYYYSSPDTLLKF